MAKGIVKRNIIGCMLWVYDIVFANLAYGLALFLRFDFDFDAIPESYLYTWLHFAPFFSACVAVLFAIFRLYGSVWRHVSYVEVIKVFLCCLILSAVHVAGTCIFFLKMPVSYYVEGTLLMFFFLAGVRVAYRALRVLLIMHEGMGNLERVLIFGAGAAGRLLLREIRNEKPMTKKVVMFADDAPIKKNRSIDGIRVRGTSEDVPGLVEKYSIDRVFVAVPSAKLSDKRRVLEALSSSKCEIEVLSGVALDKNFVDLSQLKKLRIEDLLSRDEISIDNRQVGAFLKGKTVLVTGGGGSIGSELVRQIAANEPALLIIFDIYENSAFELSHELSETYPELDFRLVIGSVADEEMITGVISRYSPDVIYHAAAHKHVPLMEDVPLEAVKNNVFGTLYTARAAALSGCGKFILISTDKAVNPTNIMGATKRMCEMVIKELDERYDTEFSAVRFGNVLGSNGSVIPLFKRQIAKGGPVTVTHPDITRFFMTVPEAVSLVISASAFAESGELFVLDMGEPVKIDALARNMIRMAGYVPDEDILIEYVGLRPGEKLYEEIMMDCEDIRKTDENDLIFVLEQNDVPYDFLKEIEVFDRFSYGDEDKVVEKIKELVVTYRPEM